MNTAPVETFFENQRVELQITAGDQKFQTIFMLCHDLFVCVFTGD